jgi:hypothetical protein
MTDSSEFNAENLAILTNWFERTDVILRRELARFRIGETKNLEDSLRHEVHARAKGIIQGELEFLVRGRFVDMGAGKSAKLIQSREGNRQLTGGRKAKLWYSRAFWARLNDLQGAIGYQLMEQSIQSILEPMSSVSK